MKAVFNNLVTVTPVDEDKYELQFPSGEKVAISRTSFETDWIEVKHTKNLPPHLTRVVGEAVQLQVRLERLGEFIKTKPFRNLSQDEREVLRNQCQAMQEYLLCLRERLGAAIRPRHTVACDPYTSES